MYDFKFEGYIKFFGNIAQVKPQLIFSEYSNAASLIFQFCSADDPVLSNVALETIGYIASNPSGKLVLNQDGKLCYTNY